MKEKQYRFLNRSTRTTGKGEGLTSEQLSSGIVASVQIEDWFYNFGPGRFTETVRFINGRLASVETGHYGG